MTDDGDFRRVTHSVYRSVNVNYWGSCEHDIARIDVVHVLWDGLLEI